MSRKDEVRVRVHNKPSGDYIIRLSHDAAGETVTFVIDPLSLNALGSLLNTIRGVKD